MQIKDNPYIPKMRVEKTYTKQDDFRVLIAGILICLLFIVLPQFFMPNLWYSKTEPTLQTAVETEGTINVVHSP